MSDASFRPDGSGTPKQSRINRWTGRILRSNRSPFSDSDPYPVAVPRDAAPDKANLSTLDIARPPAPYRPRYGLEALAGSLLATLAGAAAFAVWASTAFSGDLMAILGAPVAVAVAGLFLLIGIGGLASFVVHHSNEIVRAMGRLHLRGDQTALRRLGMIEEVEALCVGTEPEHTEGDAAMLRWRHRRDQLSRIVRLEQEIRESKRHGSLVVRGRTLDDVLALVDDASYLAVRRPLLMHPLRNHSTAQADARIQEQEKLLRQLSLETEDYAQAQQRLSEARAYRARVQEWMEAIDRIEIELDGVEAFLATLAYEPLVTTDTVGYQLDHLRRGIRARRQAIEELAQLERRVS